MSTSGKDQVKVMERDEEDEESSCDEIITEPVLTYSRMRNDVADILRNDSVSCIRTGRKILFVGTHEGRVHIMDHEGNKFEKENMPKHECTVNDLSIDAREEYVASCGDDGVVNIFGICDEYFDCARFDRPIKCVELEPNFQQTKSFVTGDTKVGLTGGESHLPGQKWSSNIDKREYEKKI